MGTDNQLSTDLAPFDAWALPIDHYDAVPVRLLLSVRVGEAKGHEEVRNVAV